MGLFFVQKQNNEILDWDLLLKDLKSFNAISEIIVATYKGLIISGDGLDSKKERQVAVIIDSIRYLDENLSLSIDEFQFKIDENKVVVYKFGGFYFIITLKVDTEKMVYLRIKNILEKNDEIFKLYTNSEVFK